MNKLYFLDTDQESSSSDKAAQLDELLDYKITTELDLKLIHGIFKQSNLQKKEP